MRRLLLGIVALLVVVMIAAGGAVGWLIGTEAGTQWLLARGRPHLPPALELDGIGETMCLLVVDMLGLMDEEHVFELRTLKLRGIRAVITVDCFLSRPPGSAVAAKGDIVHPTLLKEAMHEHNVQLRHGIGEGDVVGYPVISAPDVWAIVGGGVTAKKVERTRLDHGSDYT